MCKTNIQLLLKETYIFCKSIHVGTVLSAPEMDNNKKKAEVNQLADQLAVANGLSDMPNNCQRDLALM